MTKKNEQLTANRAQHFVLEHHYVLQISCVHFLILLPLLPFIPTRGIHILSYTWYPWMTPDAEKEHETAVAGAVAISRYVP